MYPDEGSLVSGNKEIDPLLKYANFLQSILNIFAKYKQDWKGCAKDFMSKRGRLELAQKQFNSIDTLKLEWEEYLND